MGRTMIPPALNELSSPSSPESQLAALQSLKNEIVGHEQLKELAVTYGVVQPLAGLLKAETRKARKRRRGQSNGHGAALFSEDERSPSTASYDASQWPMEDDASQWSMEDELRFQATLVAGSLANGGPAFITPLLAGDILPPLLETLRPSETPAKLLTTTLRTLIQIVDAVAREKPWVDMSDSVSRSTLTFAVNEKIYTKTVVESIAEVLRQRAGTIAANQQITLVIQLILKTCKENGHKRVLVDAGVLDTLAERLAALATADVTALDPETKQANCDMLPRACLSDLIEAISAVIKDSHYYTGRFMYSLPMRRIAFSSFREHTSVARKGYNTNAPCWEKLIPRVQTITSKTDPYTKSFPALGSSTAPADDSSQQSLGGIDDESETPLFTWLMYVARRGEGRERLSACWLLALLKNFGDRWPLYDPSKATREKYFSYLVVPLVVKMVEDSSPLSDLSKRVYASGGPAAKDEIQFILERSPLVLAELVTSNKLLQSAAEDARILPTLVQILKKSFDKITTSSKPLWQPRSSAQKFKDPRVDPASSTLGRPGFSADLLHSFKYRESVLLALAALAGDQDGLRKKVIEMGAANHIIEAMVPYFENDENDESQAAQASTTTKAGNPEPVLIAACKVTRSLSRSVSVLRTSLIDHGVAQPVYELLMHPNVKVQIAATEVITNLVLEMSPMRPREIMEAGVLKALCEQCRSANFQLRFGSLWALKHLCLGLPQPLKIQCLDELGVGWLVQVLNGEPGKPAMSTPNAAGEQVDLLNAIDEPHMDIDDEPSDDEGDSEDSMADSTRSKALHRTRPSIDINIRDRLQQIKNDEQDGRLNSERDEIRIQEQALDFIRNFIMENQNTGEMIDHLLKAFGHTRFFELIDSKLRLKNSASSKHQPYSQPATPTYWSGSTQRSSFTNPTLSNHQNPNWHSYPATEIIHAAMFVLVHLANGRPSHKHLLISQTSLMQHVHPLLSHPRRDVRVACAWMLHNLIWLDDSSDESAARERANLLRILGFEEGARVLGRDVDLDIKERAKMVIDSFSRLLGEAPGQAGRGAGTQYGGLHPSGDMSGLGGQGSRLGGLHGWRHDSRGQGNL